MTRGTQKPGQASQERARRLEAELRANLKRRKEQARARAARQEPPANEARRSPDSSKS